MLGFDLQEFLSTVSVGTASLCLIMYLWYWGLLLFRENYVISFIEWLKKSIHLERKPSGFTLVAIISIFSLGMIMEDFTEHLADSEENKNPLIKCLQNNFILLKESTLREQTLIKDSMTLKPLGRSFFNDTSTWKKHTKYSSINIFPDSIAVKEYWKINGRAILNDNTTHKQLNEIINNLYYTSKNWCYLYSIPAKQELDKIQVRIDLSRSFAVISAIGIIGVASIYLSYCLLGILNIRKNRQRNTIMSKIVHIKRIKYLISSLFIFSILMMITRLSYQINEDNFNSRAFGYYLSHHKKINDNTLKEKDN